MPRTLTGSHIREVRTRQGRTQAALARDAGISASYLNLIEHNRRRIGRPLLERLAKALDCTAEELDAGGNPALVSDLRAVALSDPGQQADADTAEALVSRFPGWAQLSVGLNRRIQDQDSIIAALADRMSHDPFLNENIHAMLSNITAIRSTASILAQVDDMPAAQRRQFHEGIHEESLRLSDAASQIAEFLGKAGTTAREAATAEEALDQFLSAARFRFAPLDQEAEVLTDLPQPVALNRLGAVIDDILDAARPVLDGIARRHARTHLETYAQDALVMPLDRFHGLAKAARFNPFALAERVQQPVHAVLRRLASLGRPGRDAPEFGLFTVTASGYPLYRKPLADFALPRHGNACPLWPLYAALSQAGQPLYHLIEHDSGAAFVTLSVAAPRRAPGIGEQADMAASMLILPRDQSWFDNPTAHPVAVGTSCRICTRTACPARIEPYLLAG